jgi:hypothetical protein
MKGERNHIIAKVWLVYESIDRAYTAVNRHPRKEVIGGVETELRNVLERVQMPWIRSFLEESADEAAATLGLGKFIPTQKGEREKLLLALETLDGLGENELLFRQFSMQAYGDSKCFEREVRARLLKILKDVFEMDSDASDEDYFRMVGLARYPERFEFRGALALNTKRGCVEFGLLNGSVSITSAELQNGKLLVKPSVKKIITIENLANYTEFVSRESVSDTLALYHGGQYSPRKKAFFKAISESMPPKSRWYHWSDIDYGGFLMLARLRREIKRDIEPYRMAREELEQYKEKTVEITNHSYLDKLKSLLTKEELTDCLATIEYMIEKRVRLEQEAMI